MRKIRKIVKIGSIAIGGQSPIAIQSMLNVPPENINDNVSQAILLQKHGCNIIRVAIPNMSAIKLIPAIKQKVNIPLVADIHFNHKLAIEAIKAGVDKIRINPGNIGPDENIKAVAKACNLHNVPIRIGVNSGSLEESCLKKFGGSTPEALCESALYNISLLEKFDFDNIVVSMKSSNVNHTVMAYRMISEKCRYPLHVGVTEAGTEGMGIIKSSIGIGSLLIDGIGDTIRVSLTEEPLKEIVAAKNILKALNLNDSGITFTSCPTCGRTGIDIINIAKQAEERLKENQKKLKVAIMGCVVNGPGEARDADIGITGGHGTGIIFKKGKIFKKVKESELIDELIKEIDRM